MTDIPDVMRSVSEVLTTAEELLEEGDSDREVAQMLTVFLQTLLVDLDKTLVANGVTGVRPSERRSNRPSLSRRHADCTRLLCIVNLPAECPRRADPPPAKAKSGRVQVSKTKRPVVNKFDATCVRCGKRLAKGNGYALPNVDQNARKKWFAFCEPHYQEEMR